MTRKEDLEAELAKLATAGVSDYSELTSDNIADHLKIAVFERLFDLAKETLVEQADGEEDEDASQWFFEACMEEMMSLALKIDKNEFWDLYNSLGE